MSAAQMVPDPVLVIKEVLDETFHKPSSFSEEVALHIVTMLQAEGYVIAPIAPTEDMIAEGSRYAARMYEIMIDANPYRLGSDSDWEAIISEHRYEGNDT
jgi:hypothetical protein